MDNTFYLILSLTVYKLGCLLIGGFLCWCGFKLFTLGIWGESGSITASIKDNKLLVKEAAPGTFFALFGAICIITTLIQGYDFKMTNAVAGKNITISTQLPKSLEEE